MGSPRIGGQSFLLSRLCNHIRKWLDFQVFSDKDYKPAVPSQNPCRKNTCGTVKNPHTIHKE